MFPFVKLSKIILYHYVLVILFLSHGNSIKFNRNKRQTMPTLILGSSTMDEDIENRKCVLHYDFENDNKTQQSHVTDRSLFDNHGKLSTAALVLTIPRSSCGNAAFLHCSEIYMHGDTFQGKPTKGITIMAFVNILETVGHHSIFETMGSSHPLGQYHFEINYGSIRWFHRDDKQKVIFEVVGESFPTPKKWVHVTGTYNTTTGVAQVYIDGEPVNRSIGVGSLSKDWSKVAHIGSSTCPGRALVGFIDEFHIFNYALSSKQVWEYSRKCCFPIDDNSPCQSKSNQQKTNESEQKPALDGKNQENNSKEIELQKELDRELDELEIINKRNKIKKEK